MCGAVVMGCSLGNVTPQVQEVFAIRMNHGALGCAFPPFESSDTWPSFVS